MARSTYVYLVTTKADIPVAGFTVRHEMRTWIERNPGDYTIWRLSDGGHHDPVDMTDSLM